MSLAVVILNYNGRGFLSRFLPAVVDHADGAAIYVADNGSTDGSIDLLRTQFPSVRVIELPTNEGYAGGYNKALEHISRHSDSFTYYCLLN
ncbi:MAG TPA: glycosyltransferase, partial [Fibrella sp.]